MSAQHPIRMVRLLVAVLFLLVGAPLWAADHVVGPAKGALNALLISGQVQGGDRVMLSAGQYGEVTVKGARFSPPVALAPAQGAVVTLTRLAISDSAGLRISGLRVRAVRDSPDKGALVDLRDARDIVLDGLDISTAASSAGWSEATWRKRVRNGVRLNGQDLTLRNSRLYNLRHAITSLGTGARVENNRVTLFAGDGIRGLGDHSVYSGNTIDTCVKIDDNHDDGFQSWSLDDKGKPGKGVVRGVRVENNLIRNGTDSPYPCRLQGIGLFDGMYQDWIIRGNTIIVNHWHGITVRGALRVQIRDNIVVDANPEKDPGPPWISITPHKDGRPSRDNVIEGNVTQAFAGGANSPFRQPQPGVRQGRNRIVQRPEQAFANGQLP